MTNIDDILILALLFGRAPGRSAAVRVVIGQYLGFGAILALSIIGSLGASLLPESVRPYLGLVPLALGIRTGWRAWHERGGDEVQDEQVAGPGVLAVAAVTLANGGDNIGVYVPVFTTAGTGSLLIYTVVFLVLVAVWCGAGRFLATLLPSLAPSLGGDTSCCPWCWSASGWSSSSRAFGDTRSPAAVRVQVDPERQVGDLRRGAQSRPGVPGVALRRAPPR